MFLAVTLYVPLSVNATPLNVKPDRSAVGSLLDNAVSAILETVTFGSGNPVMTQRFFKVSPALVQAVISLVQFTLISSEETKSSCGSNHRLELPPRRSCMCPLAKTSDGVRSNIRHRYKDPFND